MENNYSFCYDHQLHLVAIIQYFSQTTQIFLMSNLTTFDFTPISTEQMCMQFYKTNSSAIFFITQDP